MAENRQTGAAKTARIPIKIVPSEPLRKPSWIRAQAPTSAKYQEIKQILRSRNLHTVCEEASCPNIGECFSHGTATFMILGDLCTRRCPFCDVAHGTPLPPDAEEPAQIASSVAVMGLNYVVITSVDRDDLRDGGAGHFAACIRATREQSPHTRIETLVPDFRGRLEVALDALAADLPDVLNHNLETVPRLYKQARPGADYAHSLKLLQELKQRYPQVSTKSGLMVGIGETDDEILAVMRDLRAHGVEMLTIGQYLQPTRHHLPVVRFVEPAQFDRYAAAAEEMGFSNAACGPMVRSSYHADRQAKEAGMSVCERKHLRSRMDANQSILFFDNQFQKQVSEQSFALNPFEAAALPHLTGSVLDLGCGLGNLAIEAARRGASVVAVDASPTAVAHIQRVAEQEKLALQGVRADLSHYRIGDRYDTVVAIGLLMFFDRGRALELLEEIQRHVKPGGCAVINVLIEGTTYLGMFQPDHYYLFGREELVQRFAGWRVLEMTYQTFPAPDNTEKVFATIVARKA